MHILFQCNSHTFLPIMRVLGIRRAAGAEHTATASMRTGESAHNAGAARSSTSPYHDQYSVVSKRNGGYYHGSGTVAAFTGKSRAIAGCYSCARCHHSPCPPATRHRYEYVHV